MNSIRYVLLVLIFIPLVYTFSFAKYNWKNKNRMAAVGAILIAITAIVLPAVLMYG